MAIDRPLPAAQIRSGEYHRRGEGDGEIRPLTGELVGYQVGEHGTRVPLGVGMTSADGVVDVSPGSTDRGWSIRVGDAVVAWPPARLLRSPRGPSARAYELVETPAQ
ncbi:MAG: hypothetical protein M3Y87_34610 [Myxococcota bacterium]|nr:hypothetical protein [Myxococcota bacterium]